jgi:hypothetical protein
MGVVHVSVARATGVALTGEGLPFLSSSPSASEELATGATSVYSAAATPAATAGTVPNGYVWRVVNASVGMIYIRFAKGYNGTATDGGATSLTDSAAAWVTDEHVGKIIVLTGGTGADATQIAVSSNTATVITVDGWAGDIPDETTTYDIAPLAQATGASGHGMRAGSVEHFVSTTHGEEIAAIDQS